MRKLLVDPQKFFVSDCLREFKRIAKDINLLKCDMLFFPNVDDHHWTLFCANNLYETMNFFDSASTVSEDLVKLRMNNLKLNFSQLCKAVEPKLKDASNFVDFKPTDYPKQINLSNHLSSLLCFSY